MRAVTHFSSLAEALGRDAGPTALYVSAGSDTMPFVFLHPKFLADRGLDPAIAPNAIVYVDRGGPAMPLFFDDERTLIETNTLERITVGKFSGALMTVGVSSTEPGWERETTVVFLETSNEDIYTMAGDEGWRPDMFIGVCDGCRFGGNQGCENSLDAERTPLRFLGLPRWWVTEHFFPLSGSFAPGDVIGGDRTFPARFRKVGLLSPKWGRYGATLLGATLFEVEPAHPLEIAQ